MTDAARDRGDIDPSLIARQTAAGVDERLRDGGLSGRSTDPSDPPPIERLDAKDVIPRASDDATTVPGAAAIGDTDLTGDDAP
jgi:hypothetical protein